MNRLSISVAGLLLAALMLLTGCAPEEKEPPSKDLFRSIKLTVDQAQKIAATGDLKKVDSMLIPALRDEPEGAQAFLDFLAHGNSDFQLEGFQNYQIFHTDKVARVDLDVVALDTLESHRATFTFELIDSTWYLRQWEEGLPPIGSDTTVSNQ